MLLNVIPSKPRFSGDSLGDEKSPDVCLPLVPKRAVLFRFPMEKQIAFRWRKRASFEKLSANLAIVSVPSPPQDQTTSSNRYLRAQSSVSIFALFD